MNEITLNFKTIKTDPFERPSVEAVRFTMHRRLDMLPPVRPLLPGYQIEPWSLRAIPAATAVMKLAFTCSPDLELYADLTTHRGCSSFLNELTDLSGFLPDASYVVSHEGAPCAMLVAGRLPGCIFGQIYVVGVVPRHRRRGLATHMIRKSLWALHERGLVHAILQVNHQNRSAIRFFRAQDFQVNGSGTYR
jgi:ribosomal protein S18 acetylase RimI-like enzyme